MLQTLCLPVSTLKKKKNANIYVVIQDLYPWKLYVRCVVKISVFISVQDYFLLSSVSLKKNKKDHWGFFCFFVN